MPDRPSGARAVQPGRRLIGDHDSVGTRDRHGQRDALRLPGRESGHPLLAARPESEPAEQIARGDRRSRARPCSATASRTFSTRRQMTHRRRLLAQVADRFPAQRGALLGSEGRDLGARRGWTCPASGRCSPAISSSSVVFPAPEGPITAVSRPGREARGDLVSTVRCERPSPRVRPTPITATGTGAWGPAISRRRFGGHGLRRGAGGPQHDLGAAPRGRPPARRCRRCAAASPAAGSSRRGRPTSAGAPSPRSDAIRPSRSRIAARDRRGQRRVMGDEQDGGAVVAGERVDQRHQLGGGDGVQLGRGFVGQQQPRAVRQGCAQGDPLALPARQLVGPGPGSVARARRRPAARRPAPARSAGRPRAGRAAARSPARAVRSGASARSAC